ncbi:hypothetical protein B0H10DRAFT_1728259, partial [Mycena sp. CBHHK59/15]
RRNFRAAEWKDFPACLEKHVAARPLPALPLSSPAAIDAYTDSFTQSMVSAIEELVPLSRASPYTHRWWTKTVLSPLRTSYSRAHRAIVKDDRNDPSWAAMRAAKNTYLSAIRREKRAHWKQYVADAPRANIYKVVKYALDPMS